MKSKARFTAPIVALAFLIPVNIAAPAQADMTCDDDSIVSKLPKPPNGCQTERVSASGNQRPTLYWARKSVEDHWQDQVINKFGERYADPEHAACARQECSPSTIPGFTRCSYSGYPCVRKPDLADVLELNSEEIEEMQTLLTRQGFKVVADGKFGARTHDALQSWQQSKSLPDDGRPTKEILERLRKA
jgi:hypothetical protein